MSAFNGSGTFVISGTGLPFVTGTTISSTVANQLNTDLATGLSTCLTKDGQTTPTANIPMGGFKITGIAVATATGDALSYGRAATITALTVTTVNGNTWTAGTGTLTLAAGKTLTASNSLTLAGTDSTVMTFPSTSATIARTDAANTFTGVQTFSTPIAATSVATMTATVGGGVPTPPNNTTTFLRGDGTFAAVAIADLALTSAHIFVGNVSNIGADVAVSGDLTLVNTGAFTVAKIQTTVVSGTTGSGNVVFSAAPTITGHPTIEGVTSTGATGTGNLVFSASPTLSGTVGGALTFSGALTLSSALTYGGVTFANSATGTGSVVLSAAPTLTGSVNFTAANGQNFIQLNNTGTSKRLQLELNSSGVNLYTDANVPLNLYTNNTIKVVVSAAGAVQFTTGYSTGTITSDASGNLTSVSDPSQKINVGKFTDGLDAICATASDEFMGMHKWTKESGMDTENDYASFYAADNFPVQAAIFKNPKTGINSFSDRAVIMALVRAVAELKAQLLP